MIVKKLTNMMKEMITEVLSVTKVAEIRKLIDNGGNFINVVNILYQL